MRDIILLFKNGLHCSLLRRSQETQQGNQLGFQCDKVARKDCIGMCFEGGAIGFIDCRMRERNKKETIALSLSKESLESERADPLGRSRLQWWGRADEKRGGLGELSLGHVATRCHGTSTWSRQPPLSLELGEVWPGEGVMWVVRFCAQVSLEPRNHVLSWRGQRLRWLTLDSCSHLNAHISQRKSEVQRGEGSGPRSHSQLMAELGRL